MRTTTRTAVLIAAVFTVAAPNVALATPIPLLAPVSTPVLASAPIPAASPIPALGQEPVFASAAELESLQTQADQLDELVKQKVGRGEAVSDQIGTELTDIFGEIARFKEIRRRHEARGLEGTGVARQEVSDLTDRIAALRLVLRGQQAGGGAGGGAEPADTTGEAGGDESAAGEQATGEMAPAAPVISVPEGTRVVIELKGWLSSEDARVGDRFEALAADDVTVDGRVAIPRGALFEGHVAAVEPARRASRGGELTLEVDRVYGNEGQSAAVRGTVVGAAYGEDLEGEDIDAGKAVTRGILGAIIGGLIGGGKGALIGIGIGSGGTLLAEKGEEVELPTGTRLQVRFDTSVTVNWTWRPVQQ